MEAGKLIEQHLAGKSKGWNPLKIKQKKILRQDHRDYYGGTNHRAIKLAAIGDFDAAYQAIRDGEVYRSVVTALPKVAEVSLEEYLFSYYKQVESQIGSDILMRKSKIPLYLLAREIETVKRFQ